MEEFEQFKGLKTIEDWDNTGLLYGLHADIKLELIKVFEVMVTLPIPKGLHPYIFPICRRIISTLNDPDAFTHPKFATVEARQEMKVLFDEHELLEYLVEVYDNLYLKESFLKVHKELDWEAAILCLICDGYIGLLKQKYIKKTDPTNPMPVWTPEANITTILKNIEKEINGK